MTQGITSITIQVRDEYGSRKVAFNGRWLVTDYELWRDRTISVAITEKDSYLVYYEDPSSDNGYKVIDNFEDLKYDESIPEEVKGIVAFEVGAEYAEFLDI